MFLTCHLVSEKSKLLIQFPWPFQMLLLNKWRIYLFKCLQQQIYLLALRIVCGSSRQNKNSSFVLVEKDVKCRKADTLNQCVSSLNGLYLNFLAVCFFSIFSSLAWLSVYSELRKCKSLNLVKGFLKEKQYWGLGSWWWQIIMSAK